jgi:hypothetical protein
LWVLSPAAAIAALLHTHELPAERWRASGGGRALNLPGLTVTVAQMLDALESVAGAAARARVSVQPDERIKAIVQSWPARFATVRADALGYRGDSDILDIVRAHRATLGDGAAA